LAPATYFSIRLYNLANRIGCGREDGHGPRGDRAGAKLASRVAGFHWGEYAMERTTTNDAAPTAAPDEEQAAQAEGPTLIQRVLARRARQRRAAAGDGGAAHEVTVVDAPGTVHALITVGWRDVNMLTDAIFWKLNPHLAGQKVQPGSHEAQEWIHL